MNKIKRAIGVAAVALIGLSPTGAWAACVLGNFVGTYETYITGVIPGTGAGAGLFWSYCTVEIGDTGQLAKIATCTLSVGGTVKLQSGSVSVVSGPLCTFKGTFNLGGTVHTASHITLADDHLSARGVGKASGSAFSIDMVRIN